MKTKLTSDLLLSAFKYRPDNVSPKENFITECFRYILANDSILLEIIVDEITGSSFAMKGPFEVASQPPRVKDSQIDMVIVDSSRDPKKLFIEVKVGSPLNKNEDGQSQLKKYLNVIGANDRLCLLSLHEQSGGYPKDNSFLGRFDWRNIYQIVRKHRMDKSTDVVQGFVLDNFLRLMEHMKMDTAYFDSNDGEIKNIDSVTLLRKCERFLKESIHKGRDVKSILSELKLEPQSKPAVVSMNDENGGEGFAWLAFTRKFRGHSTIVEFGFFFTDEKADYWKTKPWLKILGKPKTGAFFYIELYMGRGKDFESIKMHKNEIHLPSKFFPRQLQFIGNDKIIARNYIYLPELLKQTNNDPLSYIKKALLSLKEPLEKIDKIFSSKSKT